MVGMVPILNPSLSVPSLPNVFRQRLGKTNLRQKISTGCSGHAIIASRIIQSDQVTLGPDQGVLQHGCSFFGSSVLAQPT